MKSPNELNVKIKAIASVPRLGFNDHFGSIHDAFRPFGIPVAFYQGAFWEKGIQSAIEDCITQEIDWILTLDYDTLTTPEQLQTMFQTFGRNPHMDALAANQPRRNTGMPLMTVRRDGVLQSRIEISGPIQASTAHFGLTLLRASSLKDLPKPWFFSTPAEDGTWRGPGVIDADIYFWKKFEREGRKLFVQPDVCIGHLEAMVSVFENTENKETGEMELTQKYVSVNNWRMKNCGAKNSMVEDKEETTR